MRIIPFFFKYFVASLCFLFIAINLIAVTEETPGYFINPTGDTVKIVFLISTDLSGKPEIESIQTRIKYLNPKGKKQFLYPEMASEVCFSKGDQVFRLLSVENNLDLTAGELVYNERLFLLFVKDGPIKLFRYYEKRQNGVAGVSAAGVPVIASGGTTEDIFYQRNGKLFRPGWISFKKDMVEYFADCPEIVKKIEDRTYGQDLILIADEYARICGGEKNRVN